MSVIVKTDLKKYEQYANANVKADIDGKGHKVLFEIVCDEVTVRECVSAAKQNSNILFVNYQGDITDTSYLNLNKLVTSGANVCKCCCYGCNIDESDVERALQEVPDGVSPVIELPDEYSNLEFIWRMCKKYPRVRFIGGDLLGVDGVRLGYAGYSDSQVKSFRVSPENVESDNDYMGLDFKNIDDVELSVVSVNAVKAQPKQKVTKKSGVDFSSMRAKSKVCL